MVDLDTLVGTIYDSSVAQVDIGGFGSRSGDLHQDVGLLDLFVRRVTV